MARRHKAADASARASANTPQSIPTGPIRADLTAMMPGHRHRHDGWNEARLQRFFDGLCHSGCIEDAARVADMSKVAADRARMRYPAFAEAWDKAIAHSRPELIALAHHRATVGRETVIIRDGKEHQRKIEPSDAMLRMLVNRGELRNGAPDPEKTITWDEWKDGWRFDAAGQKAQQPKGPSPQELLNKKLDQMRAAVAAGALKNQSCPCCQQFVADLKQHQSFAELWARGLIKTEWLFSKPDQSGQ